MHTINKLFLSALMLAGSLTGMAQQEERVVVHLRDGKQAEYLMQDVEYIEIQTPKNVNGNDNENLVGTVAEAVDLGLSVYWAAHNVGTDHPSGYGSYLSIDDEGINAWGDGWRLPTAEEWQELYDKCNWTWVVYNGVGCRSISTRLGNIVIPAAGVMFGEETFVKAGIGLYLSATDSEENSTAKANIIGSYFDSANIYKMEFPRTNRFSVRLVKDKAWGYSK